MSETSDTPTKIMIQLTRFNGDTFTLNAVMIEQVESLPDTTITLLNGKKLVVKDQRETVIALIKSFYQDIGLQQLLNEAGEVSE